jgi:hypothetical protein
VPEAVDDARGVPSDTRHVRVDETRHRGALSVRPNHDPGTDVAKFAVAILQDDACHATVGGTENRKIGRDEFQFLPSLPCKN